MKKLIAIALLVGCTQPSSKFVAVEEGESYVFELEENVADFVPVTVSTELPQVDDCAPKRPSWKKRCVDGFLTTREGVVLSCEM
jgi:hypothetical protein